MDEQYHWLPLTVRTVLYTTTRHWRIGTTTRLKFLYGPLLPALTYNTQKALKTANELLCVLSNFISPTFHIKVNPQLSGEMHEGHINYGYTKFIVTVIMLKHQTSSQVHNDLLIDVTSDGDISWRLCSCHLSDADAETAAPPYIRRLSCQLLTKWQLLSQAVSCQFPPLLMSSKNRPIVLYMPAAVRPPSAQPLSIPLWSIRWVPVNTQPCSTPIMAVFSLARRTVPWRNSHNFHYYNIMGSLSVNRGQRQPSSMLRASVRIYSLYWIRGRLKWTYN